MLGIGQKLPKFEVTGVKPGFQHHEEKGVSAFEPVTDESFPGKWKIIFFYPKDFTFVCPTEIAEFARLAGEFADRDAVVLGGSTDNEFVQARLAARPQGSRTSCRSGSSPTPRARSSTASACARRGRRRAIATPSSSIRDNVIQHVYATNLNVGRAPKDTLRVLDALQTDELCPCNREVGGDTLKAA